MKFTQAVIATALLASLTLLSSPALAIDKETRQMMADLRILQEQSQMLQNLVAQLADAVKTVDARLSSRLDEQINATRKGLADQKLVIDTVSNDLRVLREKVDDNNVRVGTLAQEVDALRQLVTQMNAQRGPAAFPSDDPAAAAAAAAPGAAAATPSDPAAAAVPAPIVGASPQKVFAAAQSDFYGGDYALAITGFEAYIRSFPKSEQAAEAQLNIGHSYLNSGQYEKAIDAYDTTIRTYPGASVLPDAYYKKGVALQTLNQKDEARDAFETTIKNYPDTDAARLAAQRLPELKKP